MLMLLGTAWTLFLETRRPTRLPAKTWSPEGV
jgi:hypothetical protein